MSNANTSDVNHITHNIPEVQAALRNLAQVCVNTKTAVYIGVADVDAYGDRGLGSHLVADPEWPLSRSLLLRAIASA